MPEMTNEEFIERFLGEYTAADQTKANAEGALNDFQEWTAEKGLHVTEVRPSHVKAFLNYLEDERGLAPSSINRHAMSISRFYTHFLDEQDSDFGDVNYGFKGNPLSTDELSGKELRRNSPNKYTEERQEQVIYLSQEEVQALIDHVGKPKTRNRLIIKLMYQTGLRSHEAKKIRIDNIDFREASIEVHSDKTDTPRKVYYRPELNDLLNTYIHIDRQTSPYADESPYLFITQRSPKMGDGGINYMVKKAAERAGIQEDMYVDAKGDTRWRITSHVLRHTFAVHSLKRGMGIFEINRLMGHEDIETTKVYLQVADADLQEKARRFGPSLSRDID